MKKSTIIIICVVAAIIIIGGVVTLGAIGKAVTKEDGQFNVKTECATSYNAYGYTYTPEKGNVFVVATIALKNTDYKDGLSNNPLNFDLEYNGIKYGYELADYERVSVMPGHTIVFEICYEVPESVQGQEITFHYDGLGRVNVNYSLPFIAE